jgi:hypothetical protein
MGLIFSSLILVVTAVLAWWISGYDPKLTGENKGEDILRRIIRCGLTLFFMAGGLAETLSHPDFAGFVAITIAGPMVFLWINCLCEALAHAFQSLIDNPSASSGSDPKMLTSDLDRLASLSNRGQTNEALQLCAELLDKGETSRLAMETMCFRLYGQMFDNESIFSSPSLSAIHDLCECGRFKEAESRLTQIIERDPKNLSAVFLLIQIYAQDLQRPEKARALIQSLKKRSKLPPMFPDYADYRIKQWLRTGEGKSDEGIESLLVGKRFQVSGEDVAADER